PGGATGPVREPWRAIVERGDNGLRFHHQLVNGAIREIYDLLRMSKRERRSPTDVSRVRRCRRVTLLQRGGHCGIADGSRPAAVANGLELAIPRLGRQPDFNLDVRVRRRRKRGRHTAKRRQLAELLQRRRARPRQTESSGGRHLGQGNRSVRERQGRQALARRRSVERVSVHHKYQCEENRARSASYCFHRISAFEKRKISGFDLGCPSGPSSLQRVSPPAEES